MNKRKIVLASNSPRRREILKSLSLDFTVIPSNYIEKDLRNGLYCQNEIEKSSYCKAQDVASKVDFDALVIAADTMVILDSVCLLKPLDFKEAFSLLKRLSGRWHEVVTATTLIDSKSGKSLTRSLSTEVEFRELSDEEILSYIKEKNPMDKAGSYGIQDFVDEKTVLNPPCESFVRAIRGDYYNVMGLSGDFLLKMTEDFDKMP